jgi:hypothetical protein
MTEKKQEQVLDPMDQKNATINMELNADSGYTSKDTGRISARQWGLINQIVHNIDTDEYDMLAKRIGLTENPHSPGRYSDEKGAIFVVTKYGFKRIIKRS